MKATTVAAAAAIFGSVSADGWESWSSSDPADEKTPTYTAPDYATDTPEAKASTWTDWSSTEKSEDPTATWSTWASASKSEDPSVTWSDWSSASADPSTKASTWTDWSSADPSTKTSTWSDWSSADPSTKTNTWSDWSSADPKTKTSTWSDWSSADPSSKTATWSDWSASNADPKTSSSGTWSAWDPKKTVTSTSTQWVTITVYPVDGGSSWSAWSDGSTPDAKTAVDSKTVIVTGTVTKTASGADGSWSVWNAVATPAAVDPGCKLQVSLSYGAPVWFPTPVIATSASSSGWGSWDGAASSSAVKASSGSASWGSWDPSSPLATGSASWSAWDGADKASASSASASSWSAWDPAGKASASSASASSWSAWDPAKTSAASTWSAWDGSAKASTASSSWSAWDGSAKTSSASSSASTWSTWSQSDKGISANGDKFGMTYSPYTANGGCKDASTVAGDIAQIAAKGFTSVRVYSTDCSTLENVGSAAKSHNMKIILGVFISETGVSGAKPQVDAIVAWAQWDLVELIVVGNEAVFQGRCSAAELAGFISSSKSAFQGAGYKGAVSTTDELSIWQGQGAAWCDVVDVVTANLYAFFNPTIDASGAGDFIQAEIDELSKVCPGKEVYVMETGWPSAGECNGKACPSPEEQSTAVKGIQQTSGAKVVFFSFEDEQWKNPGQFGVEQHWGCGSVFQ